MAGYLTAPAHAFFIKCNRKAITAEDGKEAWIEIIRKRERDDQGKKLP